MKVNRTYSIDVEIVEKLRGEQNASELINSLLHQYFDNSFLNKMTKEELDEFIRLELEKQNNLKKLEDLKNGIS